MQLTPLLFRDVIAVYDASVTVSMKAAADGSGASPVNLNDTIKNVANQVAGGVALSSATGCRYHPTGYNGLPALKFDAAHVLSAAGLFAAKHNRALTVAINVQTTSAVGNPVFLSDNAGAFYLQDIAAGNKVIGYGGGQVAMTGAAAGVPETVIMSFNGNRIRGTSSRDSYHRDGASGASWTDGAAYAADLGITGSGITVGAYGPGGLNMTGVIQYIAIIGHACVGSELGDLAGFMSEIGQQGNCPTFIMIGDSKVDGVNVTQDTTLPANNICEKIYQLAVGAGYRINRMRDAYPGRSMNNWLGEYQDYLLPFVYRGQSSHAVALVEFAYIDILASGPANTLLRMKEVCNRLVQSSITPIVIMPTSATTGGFEANRQTYISSFLAQQSLICPAVVRYDLDPTIGTLAAASDLTLFQDGVHETALAYDTEAVLSWAQLKRWLDGKLPVVNANNHPAFLIS